MGRADQIPSCRSDANGAFLILLIDHFISHLSEVTLTFRVGRRPVSVARSGECPHYGR